jgi:hypothetical protein
MLDLAGQWVSMASFRSPTGSISTAPPMTRFESVGLRRHHGCSSGGSFLDDLEPTAPHVDLTALGALSALLDQMLKAATAR